LAVIVGLVLSSHVYAEWTPARPSSVAARQASRKQSAPISTRPASLASIDPFASPSDERSSAIPATTSVSESNSKSEEPDSGPEVIPAPAPIQNGSPEAVNPVATPHEPLDGAAEEFSLGDCDEDWLDPPSGMINMDDCHLFGGRFWGRSDYLMWWTRGNYLPPLVTTSPDGTLPQDSGILGRPGTSVAFGDSQTMTAGRSGIRFTLGYLLLPCDDLGIEASYFYLGGSGAHYQAQNTFLPILARPYYDLGASGENAMLIAHPDFLEGAVRIDATTLFDSAEVSLRKTMWQGCSDRIDLLLGYRYTRLNDELGIDQSSLWTRSQNNIRPGTTKDLFDSFEANNQFNGGQLGLSFRERAGPWSMEILGKVALGNTSSQVCVDGATLTTLPNGSSATYAGGLLAQPTNMGVHEQNQFSVIPELGVTLGYNFSRRLRGTLGYTFIYWNKVLRAGEQMDLSLSQLPPEATRGAQRPVVLMKNTDFWAQGINAGLDYSF
jgi:hypothetical protein